MNKTRSVIKSLAIIGFFSVVLVNLLVIFFPLQHYELSIYEIIPMYGWVILGIAIFSGISIIVYQLILINGVQVIFGFSDFVFFY